MNARREAARRVEEDLANAGVSPQGNQVPPEDNQLPPQEQAPVIPPPMKDREIRSTFFTLSQAMTTKGQAVATEAQGMTTHANREVGPRVQQNESTMAFRLRDFTRMKHSMFFGSKVNEGPQYFIDEVYKILNAMGDDMTRFVMGVSEDLVKECCSTILHDNMDISRLMLHAHQVEETRLKRKNKEYKMTKAYEGGISKGRLEIEYNPRFKNRVSNQVPSNFPKNNKDRVSNLKSQKSRSGNSPSDKQTCSKCGKKHWGECLVGTGNFFGCGKEGHKVKDFPNVRGQAKGSGRAQSSGPSS
ncbi:hypothetical protein EJD97_017135 [Solanum chilense]|uniref:Gag-pol polyprotein n=1 Tax=Solanum chilense TaxID=4083 RepID=A0A6N2C9C8_SOLCI|nr:hypothetical protein EJD97_017135 [Solanum chilense]